MPRKIWDVLAVGLNAVLFELAGQKVDEAVEAFGSPGLLTPVAEIRSETILS